MNIDEIMPVHKSSWLIMLGLVPVPENIRRDCLSQDERDIEDAAASGNKKYSRKVKGRNAKRFSQNDVVAMMDRAAQIFLSGIEKRPVILGMLHKEGMIPEDDKGVLLSDYSVLIAISKATIATGKNRRLKCEEIARMLWLGYPEEEIKKRVVVNDAMYYEIDKIYYCKPGKIRETLAVKINAAIMEIEAEFAAKGIT